MKAIIFNSGLGKRMGELTKKSPKSMVKLLNGESIFERQIRILSECGITTFIITTGPFEEQLIEVTKKPPFQKLKFIFVHNDLYESTNYIYSCYLARNYLNEEFLMLHGDLVFNKSLVRAMLDDPRESLCLINKKLPLPDKDFKGRVIDGKLREVGVGIFDSDCFTFQPLYKLGKKDLEKWINSIVDFVENKKNTSVYAENAFNVISKNTNIEAFSYENYYINEIDNLEDLKKVSKDIQMIDYKEQEILIGFDTISDKIEEYHIKKPLVVIDSFLKDSWVTNLLDKLLKPIYFSEFTPNPKYDEVLNAINIFENHSCDSIISIGGGSCIDVAKAVKLFLPLDKDKNLLEQPHRFHNLKHIAIPTTAGTGSESTKYSVIYYKGIKQSLTDDMLLPDVSILEKRFLLTLPLNQRKATVFDALCHSIESLWSINSTNESKYYAKTAIELILKNIDKYLLSDNNCLEEIFNASNLAGKAINISQTTAAHALSYKLTSMFKIPHGQAVAICLPYVWEYIVQKQNKNNESNNTNFSEIIHCLNQLFNSKDALLSYKLILEKYEIIPKLEYNEAILEELVSSVNTERLNNFPIKLKSDDIRQIYYSLLNSL